MTRREKTARDVFGLTLQLRDEPDVVETYVAYHRAVWPEVLRGLRRLGVQELRIYLHQRRLFMVLEGDDDFDPGRLGQLNDDPVCAEWDALMRSLQEPVVGAEAEEWWAQMKQVFDLRTALADLPLGE